jgi:hypothetical protein
VHALALGCLAVVAVIYAWPLVKQLTTAIPGTANDYDVAPMVWNVGWTRRALDGGGNLIQTDAVLVPYGADLRLHTYGLLQGLLAYPFADWLGVVGSYNLVLVATLFLNGALGYALVLCESRQPLAALVAAAWLMLGTPLLAQFAAGRPAFASIWIVCGALLTLRGLLDRPHPWKALLLGVFLVAALLSDFQIVLFSAVWMGLYAGYRLWRDRLAMLDRARLAALGLAGLVFLVPFLLLYYPALSVAQAKGYLQPTFADMAVYSFRWWDYLTPNAIPYAYGYEFLGAALGAILLFRGRGAYRFWLVGAVALLILALGPILQPTGLPLPFAALSLWSPLGQFRTPSRLTMPALIGLTVVAGLLLAFLLPRIGSRPLVLAVAAIAIAGRLLFAFQQAPLRVQSYPEYAVYRQIAAEPGDFALLEVPFGVRSGLDRIGRGGEVLQFYQHVHGKRLLNGMVARLPAPVFEGYRGHPSLIFLSGEDPSVTEDELERDLAEVLRWSGARYVLVHRSLLSAERVAPIEGFLGRVPRLERLGVEHDLVIYRVEDGI